MSALRSPGLVAGLAFGRAIASEAVQPVAALSLLALALSE